MLLLSFLPLFIPFTYAGFPFTVQETTFSLDDDLKVPVHLGVQTKSRDSLLCENIFDAVLRKVSNKIDLSLVYIGELDEDEPDFGVVCPNGRLECAGAVHQLCAAKYAENFHDFWEFIHCSNYQGIDKIGRPETALKCASSAKINWDPVGGAGQCAGPQGYGEEGVALLKDSVKLAEALEIERTSILISGSAVCVRDQTWKECEGGHTANDFVRQINNEYERINAA